MAYTPTNVFTPVTFARASQVNQNFSELDSYFLLLTGGTLVGNLIFDDSGTTISLENITGKVTMQQLVLDPQSATPNAEEGKVFFNDNDKKIYYYNGSSWQEVGQDAAGANDGPFYIFQPQSATPTPVEGKVYYDDLLNRLFFYDGSSWVSVGVGDENYFDFIPQTATPGTQEGRTYYDDNFNKLYLYNGSAWEAVGGNSDDYYDFIPQAATPTPLEGRTYYDNISNQLFYYDGTDWRPVSGGGRHQEGFTNKTSVTVTHNLDTKYVGWALYDASDEAIIPDEVTAIDANNVKFDFAVAETGTIVVYGEASGVNFTPSITADLIPNSDDAYDIGSNIKRWKDGYFSGKLTVAGGIDPEYIQLDPQAGDGAILNNSLFVDSSDSNKLKFKDNGGGSDELVDATALGTAIDTPTISDFTSAGHDHSNAANGSTVDHADLNGDGSNSHAQIDSHISSTNSPHAVTLDQAYNGGRTIEVDAGPIICATPQSSNGDIKFCLRSSDPSSPTEAEIWYNSTDNKLRYYDGTSAQELSISISSFEYVEIRDAAPLTGSEPTSTNTTAGPTIDFADGSTQSICFAFKTPENCDTSADMELELTYWMSTSVSANIRMQHDVYIANDAGDSTPTLITTNETITTPTTLETLDIYQSSTLKIVAANLTAGDFIRVVISRIGGDGADTHTGVLNLGLLRYKYTRL